MDEDDQLLPTFLYGELKIKVVATTGFDNTPAGFVKLREWLGRKQDNGLPLYVNMEATGTYHEEAAYFLAGVGYRLSIIQPTKGKQYVKSLDKKNKTDKIDADMLARMSMEPELTLWNRPDEKLRLLKRMSKERIGLIRDRNALNNQLHALNHSFEAFGDSVERLKERIALETKQLGEIELQMRGMAGSDSELWKRINHAITIPAVNFVTAITVIAETDGLST